MEEDMARASSSDFDEDEDEDGISSTSSDMGHSCKIPKLDIVEPIKTKFQQYLNDLITIVDSGVFVIQENERSKRPPWVSFGLKLTETGKLLRFPLQEDEMAIDTLEASEFEITDQNWVQYLDRMVTHLVTNKFGTLAMGKLKGCLIKFFVQKPGHRFPNLDGSLSGKRNSSFGHLVIQLPSFYTGGHFRFMLEGRVKQFDLCSSSNRGHILGFYTGIEQLHEEILTGVRCCLIYSVKLGGDEDQLALLPAPTIKNIVPKLFPIIQEWKGNRKYPKVLVLTCTDDEVEPEMMSSLLGPLLRDNGVTLFHGRKAALDSGYPRGTVHVIGRLKLLASPDELVEKGFAKFRQIRYPADYDDCCNCELDFELKQDEVEENASFGSHMFLLFQSEDDSNVFENEDWFRSQAFWRLQSCLFLTKYGDNKSPPSKDSLLAAGSLLSLEILEARYPQDLFPCLQHFEELLNKLIQLDDSDLLATFLHNFCEKMSNLARLFPSLLKCGVDWSSLKSVLQKQFHLDHIQHGEDLGKKVLMFEYHVRNFPFGEDKNIEDFYLSVFGSILQKYETLSKTGRLDDSNKISMLISFFSIAEVLNWNLFKFIKSECPVSVRRAFFLSFMKFERKIGPIFVRLVLDAYSCSNLFTNWIVVEDFEEILFLVLFFELAEQVGADLRGLLGDIKKHSVLVKALVHLADNHGTFTSLTKYWIPFLTRLQTRIEAVLTYPDQEPKKTDGSLVAHCKIWNLSVVQMLEIVRLLLNVCQLESAV